MKILLCTLFIVVFSGIGYAQTFRLNYNASGLIGIAANAVEATVAGNYIFAGSDLPFTSSVTEINSVGNVNWSKSYSLGWFFQINDLKRDGSEYYLAGGSESNGSVFMRIDAAGNFIDGNRFHINNSSSGYLNCITKTSDGGYIAGGAVTRYDPDGAGPLPRNDSTSAYVVKFDANGDHVWHHVFRFYKEVGKVNMILNDASFVDAIEVSDGYVFVGRYEKNDVINLNSNNQDQTPDDAIILKTSTTGTITYLKQIGAPSLSSPDKTFSSVTKKADNNILVSGGDSDGDPLMLMQFPGSGGWGSGPTWVRKLAFSESLLAGKDPVLPSRFFETNDGKYAIMGTYIQTFSFSFSQFLLKIEPSDYSQIFNKEYSFGFAAILPKGSQVSDNGYISMSTNMVGFGYDYHVIKTDADGNTDPNCPGNDINSSASTPSFTWSDPFYDNYNVNTFNNNNVTPTVANITQNPTPHCQIVVCTPPDAPTTVTATPDPICSGEQVTITASGPSDPNVIYNVYDASTGGNYIGTTPLVGSPPTTATYWVEAVDNSDATCVSTTRTEVVVTVTPGAPAANAGTNQDVCGNSATLDGNAAAPGTGTWTLISGTGTITDPTNPTTTVTGLGSGNNVFQWTITSGSCPSTDAQVTITSSPTPTASNAGTTQIICATTTNLAGNTATNGTGEWTLVSGTGTITDPNNPSTSVTGLGIGDNIFEWTITSGSCTASTSQVTITNTGGPTLNLVSVDDASCFGLSDGVATVDATGGAGGFTYVWSPSGGSSATSNPLPAGSYTVTVTDAATCSDDLLVVIGEPDEITLVLDSTPSSCATADGTASVIASGGDGNYTYDWSSGGNLDTETDLSAGNYTVTVTDGNSCEATGNVNVILSDGPVITVESSSDASCFGSNDGSAEVSVTGGDGNYTYAWTPSGGSSATATGLTAGTYTITVTDGNDCSVNETITIGQADQIEVAGAVSSALCTGEDGSITLTTIGGNAPFTYLWSPNGETTETISGQAGNYSVTVTDSEGCETTENFSIGLTNNLNATIDPNGATIEGGQSVDLEVVLNPAAANATYTWTPTEGLSCTNCPNPTASPSETTTYVVAVTTGDGCSDTAMVTIVVNDPCGDIFMPTIFSPNADGQNDELCLLGSCIVELDLKIYNRWGELVFETTDQAVCWDGTFRGRPMNSAVFVYKLLVRTTDGTEIEESGNVNLVR